MRWLAGASAAVLVLALVMAAVGCGDQGKASPAVIPSSTVSAASAATPMPGAGPLKPALVLRSPGFGDGDEIPREYTCHGRDISPPLNWTDPPAGTRAFAFVVEDLDSPGGRFVHWLLYSIPPETRQLAADMPATAELPNGALQGTNDFGKIGYGGPCPPPDTVHRYVFVLYALDRPVSLESGASGSEFRDAVEGYTLAECRLTGTYGW